MIALLRQEIRKSTETTEVAMGSTSIRVHAPCSPSADPLDFDFYLYNIKSLPQNEVTQIRANLTLAVEELEKESTDSPNLPAEVRPENCQKGSFSMQDGFGTMLGTRLQTAPAPVMLLLERTL